jgi:hypothetical protein
MPRKGRRRMVGKWAAIERAAREKDLQTLQQELRQQWRQDNLGASVSNRSNNN